MDAFRFQNVRAVLSLALAMILWVASSEAGMRDLVDAPVVWHDNDRQDIPQPRPRNPNLMKNMSDTAVMEPLQRQFYLPRQIRHVGTLFGGDHVQPAANVNSLDEVPNSTWFTNRIGLFPMTVDEAANGPGDGKGPDRSGPWTITSAKTEGVTPGFNIRDPKGDVYVIKFDPPEFPGMPSSAGVIAGRILHAAGYNVPDDAIVFFRREDLVIGDGVVVETKDGSERPMVDADLEKILEKVNSTESGEIRAIASKFLKGKPIGPFDYNGRRNDDPNDHVRHEDRRELRGLRIFAAWLFHFDTKQHNSLDMYVEENGKRFVRHHLIDFASTLGTGASGPSARWNHEYNLSPAGIGGRILAIGFWENAWRKIDRPEGLDEIGFFTADYYDPLRWRPLVTNWAFSNLTDRDGYWAAKIITAFTDDQLSTATAQGRYMNPEAGKYVASILQKRRDIIGKTFFDRIPPLDFFTIDGNVLKYHDLGAERNIYPDADTRYRVRMAVCNEKRQAGEWTDWMESTSREVRLAQAQTTPKRQFVTVECQVDRGSGWSESVTVYIAPTSGRVVALDH